MSLETQRIIKLVPLALLLFSQLSHNGNPLGTNAMLRTLLDANPRWCNAANVVCTLTSSSRLLGHQQQRQEGCNGNDKAEAEGEGKGEEEREGGQWRRRYAMLLRCMILIFNGHFALRPGMLSMQQLCNAAWSIVQHVGWLPLESMQ